MADSSTIPVILRIMAERDPGLAESLKQIERALAELSQRAQQTIASTGRMDEGFAEAAEQVRRITSAADGAASAVRKMASAERQASSETTKIAGQADAVADGLRRAETQAQRLLSTVRQVGATRALPSGLTGANLALPAGGVGGGLAVPAGGGGQAGRSAVSGVMAGYARQGMAGAVGTAMRALPTGSMAAALPLSEQLMRQAEALNRTLDQVETRYDQTARRAVELGRSAGMAMMAAGAGVAALLGYAVQVAGQFEQLRAKLETVQKSAVKAGETFDFARELAAKTPFDVQGVVSAAVQLEVYGTRAKEVLPLVADLAAGMGKSIEDTSLTVGKAMSGSLEGWESLRNEYGVSNTKLAQYGATLTTTGGIAVGTAADLEKARTALQRIIQTEFGGAVERQSRTLQGSLSNAGDSVQNLAATYGQALVPMVTTGARAFSAMVDTASAVPGPLKTIVAVSAAAGSGILVLGGGAVMAAAGLVAMNAQLLAAAPNIAAAGVAARVTSGLLTGMAGAAGLARGALVALGTTPMGIALTALAAGFVAVDGAINHFNDQQVALGNAFSEQSKQLFRATQEWRALQSAIDGAAASRGVAGITLQGGQAGVSDDLQRIGDTVSPDVLLKSLHSAFGSLEDVTAKAKDAREEIDALLQQRRALEDLKGLGPGMKVDIGENYSLQKLFPGVEFLTAEHVQDAVKNLDARLQALRGTFAGLQFAKGLFEDLEVPLNRAVEATKRLDGYLKFAGKANDVRTLTEALGETQETLAGLQKAAQEKGLPAYDASALRQRMLDPATTEADTEAISRILELMGEVESQTERINQANAKAAADRIALSDQEFARAQAGRDEDLDATLKHLERKLEAVRGNAEQETQVLNQIHQVKKGIAARDLEDQKKAMRGAIDGALRAADELASSGGGTASEVAQSYRGVMSLLTDWERAHRTLLDQVPELRQEYADLRDSVSGKIRASENRVPPEKLANLREQTQEIQAAADGQQEQLQAVRQSISLYQTALRADQDLRGSAEARTAIQKEINALRRRETDIVEQIAESERQSVQQTASLHAQLIDQEISSLEVRLSAGEDVEQRLKEKRHERYLAAVDDIESTKQAEVRAAEGSQALIDQALDRARVRRQILDEQERLRIYQGLRKEVADVQQAEKDKQAARYASERQARIGGEKSPILTPDEAFSYGLDLGSGVNLGDFATREKAYYGSRDARWASPEKGGADYWSDAAKRVATASESAGKGLDKIPPAADRVDVSATSLRDGFASLAASAVQAAAALSTVKGGGKSGGKSGGDYGTGVPEGTTTDGKQSFAPGAGPEGATLVDSSGYPVIPIREGYPNLMERRIPTPVEMGAISPRVAMQPVVTSSRTVEQKNTFNIAPSSADPDIRTMEDAAARFMRRQERRQGLLAGGWR